MYDWAGWAIQIMAATFILVIGVTVLVALVLFVIDRGGVLSPVLLCHGP